MSEASKQSEALACSEKLLALSNLIKDHVNSTKNPRCDVDLLAKLFLRYKKDNIASAFESFKMNQKMREELKLENIDPLEESMKRELLSEKFTVIQQNAQTLAIFTAKHHLPLISNENNILKGILYQVDAALYDESLQTNGMIIIYNMIGSKYTNFDYEMTLRLLNIFIGVYPVKIKKIFILCPPFWFRAPYRVMRLFVKEKMRERILLTDLATLVKSIPSNILPNYLGGKFEHDHLEWLKVCFERNGTNITDEYFQESLIDENNKMVLANPNYLKGRKNSKSYTINRRSTVQFNNESTWNDILNRHKSLVSNDLSVLSKKPNQPKTSTSSDNQSINGSGSLQRRASAFMGTSVYTTRSSKDLKDDSSNDPISDNALTTSSSINSIVSLSRKRPTSSSVVEPEEKPCTVTPPKDNSSNKNSKITSEFDVTNSDSKTKINIGEFVKRVAKLGEPGLTREFDLLFRNEPFNGSVKSFKLAQNRNLNRYRDVPCLENSIVQLKNNQYIHANWVHGYDKPYHYIFTQGPMDETMDHFWQMVWETNTGVIVMLTKVVEGNRVKCSQYWPSEVAYNSLSNVQKAKSHMTRKVINQDTKTASLDCLRVVTNNFEIALISEKYRKEEKVFISTLRLTNLRNLNEDPLEVTHLLYVAWPDFDVPSETDSFKRFVSLVNTVQERYSLMNSSLANVPKKLPIIIHCSAGIGRTGTFATVDINLKMAKSVSQIDVPGVVAKLRKQRALTVQVPKQYVFIHHVLLSYINDN